MGTYIVLEGLEGCGKSTQAALLKQYCEAQGIDYIHIRQPGSTTLAEGVRGLLLHNDQVKVGSRTEFMLMLSCWVDTHIEVVLPALKAGKMVISERGFSALFAYQIYGRQLINHLDMDSLYDTIANLFTVDEIADLVSSHSTEHLIYLEQSLERSMANMQKRFSAHGQKLDRIEQETQDFFKRVQSGLEIFDRQDSPWHEMLMGFEKHTVDVERHGIEEVHQQLVKILEEVRS